MTFFVLLEFRKFYHFYILVKSKVTQGYLLQLVTFFMKKLKNSKIFNNILHFPFPTSATQTLKFIESAVRPLALPDYEKLTQ